MYMYQSHSATIVHYMTVPVNGRYIYVKQFQLTRQAVIQVLQHRECQTSQFLDEVLLAAVTHEYDKSGDKKLSATLLCEGIQLLALKNQCLQKENMLWLMHNVEKQPCKNAVCTVCQLPKNLKTVSLTLVRTSSNNSIQFITKSTKFFITKNKSLLKRFLTLHRWNKTHIWPFSTIR